MINVKHAKWYQCFGTLDRQLVLLGYDAKDAARRANRRTGMHDIGMVQIVFEAKFLNIPPISGRQNNETQQTL